MELSLAGAPDSVEGGLARTEELLQLVEDDDLQAGEVTETICDRGEMGLRKGVRERGG